MYLSTYSDRNGIIIIDTQQHDFQQIDTPITECSSIYCNHKKIYVLNIPHYLINYLCDNR